MTWKELRVSNMVRQLTDFESTPVLLEQSAGGHHFKQVRFEHPVQIAPELERTRSYDNATPEPTKARSACRNDVKRETKKRDTAYSAPTTSSRSPTGAIVRRDACGRSFSSFLFYPPLPQVLQVSLEVCVVPRKVLRPSRTTVTTRGAGRAHGG